jgi:hypothetical protein
MRPTMPAELELDARARRPRAGLAAALVMLLILMPVKLCPAGARGADELPQFKVSGRHMTGLALLVPKETTSAQLKALILALRKARQDKRLDKLIPATTPGGSAGPYGIVVVSVYTEPEWATSAALERCTVASWNTPTYVECGRHIRAYYYYAVTASEQGSIGYAEGNRIFTKVYEKLF